MPEMMQMSVYSSVSKEPIAIVLLPFLPPIGTCVDVQGVTRTITEVRIVARGPDSPAEIALLTSLKYRHQ